jgi:hypothetical protein
LSVRFVWAEKERKNCVERNAFLHSSLSLHRQLENRRSVFE